MKPLLLAVAGSFALGAALVGYIAWRGDGSETGPAVEGDAPQAALASPEADGTPSPTPSATASRAAAAAEAVEQMAETQGGIDQRLAAAEQRLSRLDLQAQAAAGNAARAEGLLIAFAIRRAIDKGAQLGYLADQLRLRFGDALPNATNSILSFSRDPVTLDQLTARLDGLAPQLQSGDDRGGFERFSQELAALFTVRRESAPSPQPEMRIERARLFLLSGRTDAAIEEVRNMPGAANAQGWIRDAERYAAAQQALDLIETAAVLEPRRLRDGAGNRISQPSPGQETPEE
ncbi:MICOS complex subunit MIC60 [Qipengyuania sphaerica]|uniref:MICOS complex subunit MIC60 n=1 Tax=Qipengyuania sphaerica TaxID=2867243 RepID=UPI001FFD42D9|nr:MICOS complex subunit MIC60 [Qipengyuania sphaerica]